MFGPEMQPADIIAFTAMGGDGLSRVIGGAQVALGAGRSGHIYSHVTLKAFTPGFNHEAKFPLVGFYPIDITRDFDVWRLPKMTHAKADKIIHTAMAHHGDLYNLIGLFTAGRLAWRHSEVCSQYVGLCAASAGYHFRKEGLPILAPDPIFDYPGIRLVGHHTAPKEKR